MKLVREVFREGGGFVSAFQAVVLVILKDVLGRGMLQAPLVKYVAILTDSQGAIKAVHLVATCSILVSEQINPHG